MWCNHCLAGPGPVPTCRSSVPDANRVDDSALQYDFYTDWPEWRSAAALGAGQAGDLVGAFDQAGRKQ